MADSDRVRLGRLLHRWSKVAKRSELRAEDKVVAWDLRDHGKMRESLDVFEQTGECHVWPSINRLAGNCGMQPGAVRHSLARLQDAGLINGAAEEASGGRAGLRPQRAPGRSSVLGRSDPARD